MENLFKSIIGEQLSSVEFVQDYLQLHFDGNTLTCYVWPDVKANLKNFNIEKEGYRDAICEIISHKVIQVKLVEKHKLELFFSDGYLVSLNLVRHRDNKHIPELAYFKNIEKEWLVLE